MSKKSCFNKIKNFQEFFKQHNALTVAEAVTVADYAC